MRLEITEVKIFTNAERLAEYLANFIQRVTVLEELIRS